MSSARTARYLDVLTLPHVPLTFGVAIIGRAAYALVLLPLLYAVSDATGSIALAGVAVALYGATASFLAPIRAWFIDRYGARRVLAALTVAFGGTITTLAIAALTSDSGSLLILLAGIAGAFAPPLGPTMRVAWGRLAPTGDLLRKGLSLDAVVEELLYLAGPAAAGFALVVVAPGAALFVPAALVIVGGLLFVATPTVGGMGARDRSVPSVDRGSSLLLRPRFVGLLLPVLVAGAVSGTISVAIPVVLAEYGGSAAAGIALGLFAGGSALGGLLFGALKVPGSPARQLVVLATLLLLASSSIVAVSGVAAVSVVLAAAGLFFSPVMIVAYVAAHVAGGEHQQNAATTWVNTGHNVGAAAGSALAGVLIQSIGTAGAIIAIGAGALGLLVASSALARR
ncbi:MAG TPA: MFS transporter [Plantibacter sp.]|uniref:MFS transporter n=1 Tax=unclassified Plantibacter TaxID=2624265 RepID=UPI002BFAC416|nr:MFS transporter [Plantibacter sp.]